MSVLMVVRFKVVDRRRFVLMQDTFNAFKPKNLVVLAWDISPHCMLGGREWDAIGVFAFPDQNAVDAYYASDAYRSFSVLAEAAGESEVDIIRTYPPTEKAIGLHQIIFHG